MAKEPKAPAPPAAPPQREAGMITVQEAAALLMRTPERIRQLVREGWIPKPSKNMYPLVGVVQGYVRYRDDHDRRAQKTAAASRVSDARAREIELRIQEKENTLIELEEAVTMVDIVIGVFRSELAGVPSKLTRNLAERRKIHREVDEVLKRATTRFKQSADSLRKGGPAIPTDAKDAA